VEVRSSPYTPTDQQAESAAAQYQLIAAALSSAHMKKVGVNSFGTLPKVNPNRSMDEKLELQSSEYVREHC
jgi:hypothetical protein